MDDASDDDAASLPTIELTVTKDGQPLAGAVKVAVAAAGTDLGEIVLAPGVFQK
jgi:hypothetical protein